MTGVHVVLRYQGVDYDLAIPDGFVDDLPPDERRDAILYFWTEGNFGCDCNRSLMIDKYHADPPDFPNRDGKPYQEGDVWYGLACGKTIELVSLADVTNDVETPISLDPTPTERLAAIGLKAF